MATCITCAGYHLGRPTGSLLHFPQDVEISNPAICLSWRAAGLGRRPATGGAGGGSSGCTQAWGVGPATCDIATCAPLHGRAASSAASNDRGKRGALPDGMQHAHASGSIHACVTPPMRVHARLGAFLKGPNLAPGDFSSGWRGLAGPGDACMRAGPSISGPVENGAIRHCNLLQGCPGAHRLGRSVRRRADATWRRGPRAA